MKIEILIIAIFLFASLGRAQNTNHGVGAGNAGASNTSIGSYSGDVITGDENSFVGASSGKVVSTGYNNSFFGSYSGWQTTTGYNNTFIGSFAGQGLVSGNNNTFVGKQTGQGCQGNNNTFIGSGSGFDGRGNENAAVGVNSCLTGSGSFNAVLGNYAARSIGTGNYNTVVGDHAGFNLSGGSSNIFIGYHAGYNESGSNKLYLDNSNTSIPLIFGDFSSNQIGINIRPNTTHTLTVGGTIHATGLYVNGQSITDAGFEFWTKVGTNIWNNTGNVGIGTTLANNPNNYRLAVKGKLGAHEVQIENNSLTWSDFVFYDDYELLPLAELEEYIKENKHLPEIPTEQEVRGNGILVSEMNAKLLQKVEELTLYVIELKKEIETIKLLTTDK